MLCDIAGLTCELRTGAAIRSATMLHLAALSRRSSSSWTPGGETGRYRLPNILFTDILATELEMIYSNAFIPGKLKLEDRWKKSIILNYFLHSRYVPNHENDKKYSTRGQRVS